MQTPPAVTTAPNTPRRQRRYLLAGLPLLAALIAVLVMLDRTGSSRQENRGRSNEQQMNRGGAANNFER